MSAEYNAMKESYDKIGYSIVKLDENNKAITEQLGDKYTSMLDMQSVVLLNDNFPDLVNIEHNYSLESKEFVSIMNELKEANVDYLSIELANKKWTSNEIIERLSGGDLTEGSCSSLAFAYVGNKAGYDVLDFRDGESRVFFSSRNSIRKIANLPNINSVIICGKNDIQCVNKLFETMKAGISDMTDDEIDNSVMPFICFLFSIRFVILFVSELFKFCRQLCDKLLL